MINSNFLLLKKGTPISHRRTPKNMTTKETIKLIYLCPKSLAYYSPYLNPYSHILIPINNIPF